MDRPRLRQDAVNDADLAHTNPSFVTLPATAVHEALAGVETVQRRRQCHTSTEPYSGWPWIASMSSTLSHTDTERLAVSQRTATRPSSNTTPWNCGSSGALRWFSSWVSVGTLRRYMVNNFTLEHSFSGS